jgi:tetratricopeptide (TPR) repeat protein
LAFELLEKEQYGSAKDRFRAVYEAINDKYDLRKQTSLYNMAVCAVLLYHEDAEKLIQLFMSEYPEYPQVEKLWYYLGNFYFDKRQYKQSLKSYEQTETRLISVDEYNAYKFKKGYCYFMLEDYNAAKPLLKDAASANSQFKNKALFYYSHILYVEQSYTTALTGFEQLKNEETYSEIVPFYVAHIYFATERYEELVYQADELVQKSSKKRLPEINKLIAQSCFHLKRYTQAIVYFVDYFSTFETSITCDDYYMLGYSYYNEKLYNQAVTNLTKAVCENDTMNQFVYFTLGDAYLKQGQKELASRAFFLAHNLKINQIMIEDALFEYAKLQYELSSNPFLSAISAFEKYLNEYPQSQRKNEVESYLSTIYLTTKNYRAAIVSLEKINNKSIVLMKAYQRVNYFRALELFNDGQYVQAENHLDAAITNNFDPIIYAQALFWKAEIAYRKENYTAAKSGFSLFLSLDQAKATEEYSIAFYNDGYVSFKLKQYKEALNRFLHFQKLESQIQNKRLLSDAYNRAGDCYFMLSDLTNAKIQYQKVIDMNLYDVDYALYQLAQSMGGLRQFEEKIKTMKLLENKFPKSPYIIDAQYEIANTYLAYGQNREAAAAYQEFIQKYPKRPLTRTAMLKLGSIYYNLDQDEKALETFKTIISNYPGSEEASIALKNMENIYTANGNVDEFFNYVRKDVSFAKITPTYQDSVMYNSAAEKYFNRKFNEAEKDFDKYINQFPEGVFVTNAHFYLAECAFIRTDYEKALKGYEYIIKQKNETFLETSLANAANILYAKKEYEKALSYYDLLVEKTTLPTQKTEAMVGKIRCYWEKKNYSSAISTAELLLKEEKATEKMKEEAKAIIARSAMATENYELAKTEYTALSKQNKSEIVSEALYNLAFIEYKKKNLETAEKKIFEVLANIFHDYWLAKSYILLGDIYLDKGNSFQAKHTYSSIIENYDGDDDLKQIATGKYNKIIEKEKNNE